MKSNLLFIVILFAFIFNKTVAQSSATESGIAIQGIARDNNYTARINETLSLDIEFYYEENSSKFTVTSIAKVVDTDDFGVFSTTVDPGAENTAKFAGNLVYMKISEGSTIISDEKLKHVPYAISANNGVPTGSVIPFLGKNEDVPSGWVLCDGSALPSTATRLIEMIGSNTPDLRAMFIRGAGKNGNTEYTGNVGPVINEIQTDTIQSHLHGKGTISASGGAHSHTVKRGTGIGGGQRSYASQGGTSNYNPSPISGGSHTHTVSGSTANTGGTETRPINYGVNYIIKL